MFPHGVIIQSQSVLEGIRFTNNEFKDQVQDIKNRISELDNIEVKYAGKEENKDGNWEEVNLNLSQFLDQSAKNTLEPEISETHKVRIKSWPRKRDGNKQENDHESKIEKWYNIKTMAVEWEGKSWWMHVFIDTSAFIKLEEANNNIKCQKIMFASVSHEFRTPLNSIINSNEWI